MKNIVLKYYCFYCWFLLTDAGLVFPFEDDNISSRLDCIVIILKVAKDLFRSDVQRHCICFGGPGNFESLSLNFSLRGTLNERPKTCKTKE